MDRASAKLLVVDDEESIRLILKKAFIRDGYAVVTAANGAEALAALLRDKPDLLILDLNMPVMDGFAVLRKLRADDATRNLAVIVMSGMPAPSSELEALERGADDFVGKPFVLDELRARVRGALRRAQLGRNSLTRPP